MKFIIDYWYIIGYFIYCYLFALTYLIKIEGLRNYGFWTTILLLLVLIPVTLMAMILMPFIWFVWFMQAFNRIKIDRFTIHELTEENKTTLMQLGFEEREDFVSKSNFSYSGFRKNIGGSIISVCYNGRVSIWGDLTLEVKHLKKQILNLPKEKIKEIKGEEVNE